LYITLAIGTILWNNNNNEEHKKIIMSIKGFLGKFGIA